jgi:mannose-6-phosphate isomerase-like protein (cupin superfamily)
MSASVHTAEKPAMTLCHATPETALCVPGRRTFFTYRDLGVTEASHGQMRAQVMSAITGMTEPTGWHYHVCDGQFVYALKGWVELEFETGDILRLQAGESLFIPGGMRHNEISTSDDLEILEVCVQAAMGTVPCDRPAGLPPPSSRPRPRVEPSRRNRHDRTPGSRRFRSRRGTFAIAP